MINYVPVTRDKDNQVVCPACNHSSFSLGPTALGTCANVVCLECKAKWNWLLGFEEMQPINEVAEYYADNLQNVPVS